MHPLSVTHEVIRRVTREVAAGLEHAALFGSRARGDARPDSDFDILLVFTALPPDREPFATQAEELADEVALEFALPVSVWSVSVSDFQEGRRTPMLVDALDDAIPLWCRSRPLPRLPFSPADAVFCAGALLDRVAEGGEDFRHLLANGELRAAGEKARGDVVRLCTAALLLGGVTRPRRTEALRSFLAAEGGSHSVPREVAKLVSWALDTSGPGSSSIPEPTSVARTMDGFAAEIARRRTLLRESLAFPVARL